MGLHATAGPVREDVDLAVPLGWTHLRRRRRRFGKLPLSPARSSPSPQSLWSAAPSTRSPSSSSSTAPSSSRVAAASRSSSAARPSSPQPVLPPTWSPDRPSYLSVVVLPLVGGMADPRPSAAAASSQGGGPRAAPRPAAVRPPPPVVTQPPTSGPGFVQQQQASGAQHTQLQPAQQQQQLSQGQGGLYPPPFPQHRPTATLPFQPLQPPSRQPGPPAYFPQAAHQFMQQRPFAPPSFQPQQQQFPQPHFGQYQQQQFMPPAAAAVGQVGSRNKRKKKKGGQPGQVVQQLQFPQQSDQLLQPQLGLSAGAPTGAVQTVTPVPEASGVFEAPSSSEPALVADAIQEESNFSLDETRTEDIPQVSQAENNFLTSTYSEEEVRKAVFQMEHNKAPGPDGFPAEFYQSFWDVIKIDLLALFADLHDGHLELFRLNFGEIILLPKVIEAERIQQYRPICLLNVIYRCTAMLRSWIPLQRLEHQDLFTEILNLQRCKALHSLPSAITQLCKLRRLGLDDTPINQVPEGIGRLIFLNDLEGFPLGGESDARKTQDGWKLEELKHLSQLRQLGMIKLENATPYSRDSLLTDKRHLKVLNLFCTERTDEPYSEEDVSNIEKIFEQLIPPRNLEDLSISRFFGRRYPTWLGSTQVSSVIYLNLIDCSSCVHLPPIGQLPNLRYLKIVGAAAVTKIGPEFVVCRGVNPRSMDVGVAFPKLEFLFIKNMPNWEEWSFVEEKDASAAAATEGGEHGSADIQKGKAPSPMLQLLPRLKVLYLVGCPKLRDLPRQLGEEAASLEELQLRNTNCLKVVEDLPFLSHKLLIEGCGVLERVSNLPRVRELRVNRCPKLRCVEGLGSLQQLWVDEGMQDTSKLWVPGLQDHRKLHGEVVDVYTWPRG
ncbi:hypothetical protein ACQ4PT_023387 [Festuca glaucescens]